MLSAGMDTYKEGLSHIMRVCYKDRRGCVQNPLPAYTATSACARVVQFMYVIMLLGTVAGTRKRHTCNSHHTDQGFPKLVHLPN